MKSQLFNSISVIILLLIVVITESSSDSEHSRWYYTGQLHNYLETKYTFNGQMVSYDLLTNCNSRNSYQNSNDNVHEDSELLMLHCGGLYIQNTSEVSITMMKRVTDAVLLELNFPVNGSINDYVNSTDSENYWTLDLGSQSVRIDTVCVYELVTAINYREDPSSDSSSNYAENGEVRKTASEIGLYDLRTKALLDKSVIDLVQGYLILAKATVRTGSIESCFWTNSSFDSDDDGDFIRRDLSTAENCSISTHDLHFTSDRSGRISVMRHLWETQAHEQSNNRCDPSNDTHEKSLDATILHKTRSDDLKGSLRVMTYNLWHNNPANWVYRDPL